VRKILIELFLYSIPNPARSRYHSASKELYGRRIRQEPPIPMYDLLIATALILMVIGPPILTAIQRSHSDDLHY
jgi:hypothetical protein